MFHTKDVAGSIWAVDGDDTRKQEFVDFKAKLEPFLKAERYFLTVLPDAGICIVDDKTSKKPLPPAKLRKFLEAAFGRVGYAAIAAVMDEMRELTCKKEATPAAPVAPQVIEGTLDKALTAIIKNYVCWAATDKGGSQVYVRTSLEHRTWDITSNALVSLKGSGLFDQLEKDIDQARRTGATAWSVTSTEEGGQVYADIYNKLYTEGLLDTIVQDASFFKTGVADFTNDENVDALSYFPSSAPLFGSCQHWLNFESQMPDIYRPVWRSLFAGIFDDQNRSRQIAILCDKGQTGKSGMIRAINTVAGSSFMAAVSKGSLDNQFWGSKVFGKRLVVFSDSGNAKITQMDKIKQISGSDPIDIERKGKDSFSWTPNTRVIVTTNRPPELDIFQRHQTSRMVLIPLEATKDPEVLKTFCLVDENGDLVLNDNGEHIPIGADYDVRMAEEFWDYLELCRESYAELCPNRKETIISPAITEDMTRNAASEDSDIFSYILSFFLQPDPQGRVSNSDIRVILEYIAENSRKSMDLDLFREFAKGEGFLPTRIKYRGVVCRGFSGISLRPGVKIVNGDIRFVEPTETETEAEHLPGAAIDID